MSGISGAISMPQGRGNYRHNIRGYSSADFPKNIDQSRLQENIVFKTETVAAAYHRIFDQALNDYNQKQKRKDRQILNYRTHINNSKNGEKEFYEDVLQWGDKALFENHPELRSVARDCLLEYISTFEQRNPNLELIGAYIHMDEASPHMHFDYIPVATGYKNGLSKRNSLDRAMRQMGFGAKLRDKKDNATKQWKEHERAYFADICRSRGLEVTAERASERDYIPVPEFRELAKQAEKNKKDCEFYLKELYQKKMELTTTKVEVKKAEKQLEQINSSLEDANTSFISAQICLKKLQEDISTLKQEKAKFEQIKAVLTQDVNFKKNELDEINKNAGALYTLIQRAINNLEYVREDLAAGRLVNAEQDLAAVLDKFTEGTQELNLVHLQKKIIERYK